MNAAELTNQERIVYLAECEQMCGSDHAETSAERAVLLHRAQVGSVQRSATKAAVPPEYLQALQAAKLAACEAYGISPDQFIQMGSGKIRSAAGMARSFAATALRAAFGTKRAAELIGMTDVGLYVACFRLRERDGDKVPEAIMLGLALKGSVQ